MPDEMFENSDSDAATYKYCSGLQELILNITLSPSDSGNCISATVIPEVSQRITPLNGFPCIDYPDTRCQPT